MLPQSLIHQSGATCHEDVSYVLIYCRRIYPQNNEEKYVKFFENSCSLFTETAASKARIECARCVSLCVTCSVFHFDRDFFNMHFVIRSSVKQH